MPPELVPDDEDYASSEDSDFAPDAAPAKEDADSSDDESEPDVAKAKSTKRKRGLDEEAEDDKFENSGDEAIIKKGLKRQKKNSKKGKENDEVVDDEGGEGGVVKTRSMRAAAKTEKKVALVDLSKVTVDVDDLWQKMISGKPLASSPKPTPLSPSKSMSPEIKHTTLGDPELRRPGSPSPNASPADGDSMIMIKRSYTFAGEVHVEEKLVPRNSAEAKLFLASQPDAATIKDAPSNPFTKPKRAPKKARRSIFEPVVDLPQREDLKFGPRKLREAVDLLETGEKGKKLNTVEKSAMDWAGFVDKEGIADELDAAGKKKGGFKERQEFIARTEMRKEEDARKARGLPSLLG